MAAEAGGLTGHEQLSGVTEHGRTIAWEQTMVWGKVFVNSVSVAFPQWAVSAVED